jgi:hypothetical protein
MQEAELDRGLIQTDLPAPSRSSSPKSSYISRKFGQAEGNFVIIRPGLASEPGVDSHRTTAPSIGNFAAFKGAAPAEKDRPVLKKTGKIQAISHSQRGDKKTPPVSTIHPAGAFSARPDISEGRSFAYPTISEMKAALGGTGMDEPSQAPANLIQASQVSKSHVSAIQNAGSIIDPSILSSPDVPLQNGVLDLIDSENILNFHQAGAARRRARSKWKVTPQQNSAPSSFAYEDIALLADRSFSGSVRQAEPGWTAKIGNGHSVSDEIRIIRESRRSRDRLERLQRLQNVDREREMFGVQADAGREGRIKVTIGRIDVRADIAPGSMEKGPGAVPASRSAPRLTLDGYLKQRNEGRI